MRSKCSFYHLHNALVSYSRLKIAQEEFLILRKTLPNIIPELFHSHIHSARDSVRGIFNAAAPRTLYNTSVHERTFVLCFSSSFEMARSLTKRCFWTATALLEVGDILLVKQNKF